MSQQDCKNGVSCKFHAVGKCLHRHPGVHLAVSAKKQKQKVSKISGHLTKAVVPQLSSDNIRFMARSVNARKLALTNALAASAAGKAPEAPKGWSLIPAAVDVKQPVLSSEVIKMYQDAYDSEFRMTRSALASAYGNRAVPFTLPVIIEFSSTNTTGLVNTPYPIVVSDAPEWSSLAALFDEYKFVAGTYCYTIFTPTSTIVLATSSLTSRAMPCIGYDPADATAPTATTDVTSLRFHDQLVPRINEHPSGGSYMGLFGRVDNSPYRFRWNNKNSVVFTGNGGAVGPGEWKATAGNVSSFPDGTIKVLFQSGESTVKVCYSGTMYWNLHFRMRS